MTGFIDATDLKRELADGQEICLLDIREQGQYGEGHPFHAVPLSYSRLELDVARLVPNKAARLILLGDGESLSARSGATLRALGYSNIRILKNGVQGWCSAGYTLFKGVHLPSKTLGELVELSCHTPRVTADMLRDMIAKGQKLVVLDGRSRQEYKKMTIPGAVCCPNAELAYRLHRLAPDACTIVVVTCAGRTRSIIGAQSLINIGTRHPVYALENGTQGWYLNDYPLEYDGNLFYPEVSANDSQLDIPREKAAELAEVCEVGRATAAQLNIWFGDPSRSTYFFDVRTAEEFKTGSVPGAVHVEGGQLIQGTDLYIGVRNARVVLYDSDGIRAPITGSWLSQMGYEVHVLNPAEAEAVACPQIEALPMALLAEIGPAQLEELDGAVQLIDIRPSMSYRVSHLRGAVWSTRSRIHMDADGRRPVVFMASDPRMAALAASELGPSKWRWSYFLKADLEAWKAAGLQLEATPLIPADQDCIDYLFFVHDRHDGNKQAAKQYLAWEMNLLSQLDEQEKATYRLRTLK